MNITTSTLFSLFGSICLRLNFVKLIRQTFVVLFHCLWISQTTANELFPEIMPSPAYQPEEVVGIQMRALAKNNLPFENAGIEMAFRFASPGNKKITGPLERFKTLFDVPTYRPMINHAQLKIGPTQINQNTAIVPVLVHDSDGKQTGYLFSLSQQGQGRYENCWMTDRVLQVDFPNQGDTIM